ncbi:MAG TPA: hypothetical protein VFZ53_32500 [Polyangiaceae bacterium]
MSEPNPDSRGPSEETARVVAKAILDVIASVPSTAELRNLNPRERSRALATQAALKAAAVSGTLALPPGPLGVLTLVPDLVVVWRIQAQMVADIGGAYGKSASVTQEQMIYCLFRHAAAQVVRDLGVRMGERFVFRAATLAVIQSVAARLGLTISKRVIAKSVSRWLPIVGSLGVAAYAFYDTGQVAATAVELFEEDGNERRDAGIS